jgi:hypothetical protein
MEKEMPITRRKVNRRENDDSSNLPKEAYCRKCAKTQSSGNFYRAVDPFLDKNNLMSICKECCDSIFESFYKSEHNFEKALFLTCRTLNVAWIPGAVESTKTQVSNKLADNKEMGPVFGIYKSKMSTFTRVNKDLPLTFSEPTKQIKDNSLDESDETEDVKSYLHSFWGENFSFDDYTFLESELARYKKTHKCDTAAEESLLRLICFTELSIRKKMALPDGDASVEIKRLTDLMKSAAIDPAKTSVAGSGKAQDTFSGIIKLIEENEPASYYGQEGKKLFKDFDNIEFYFRKYVTRPLKNFMTQSRDFNVEEDGEGLDEEDFGVIQDEQE